MGANQKFYPVGANEDFFHVGENQKFYPVGANQPEAIRDNRNPTPTKKAPEGAAGTTPQEAAKSIIRRNQYLGIRLNTLDYGSNCHVVNKRPD